MPLPLTVSCFRLVLPFWYRLTWVVPEKGPLNMCSSSKITQIFTTIHCCSRPLLFVANKTHFCSSLPTDTGKQTDSSVIRPRSPSRGAMQMTVTVTGTITGQRTGIIADNKHSKHTKFNCLKCIIFLKLYSLLMLTTHSSKFQSHSAKIPHDSHNISKLVKSKQTSLYVMWNGC